MLSVSDLFKYKFDSLCPKDLNRTVTYKQSAGITFCNAIVNQYSDWTSCKLDSDELAYLESLVCTVNDGNNEPMDRPSVKFKDLWCGTVPNHNDNSVVRFLHTPDGRTYGKGIFCRNDLQMHTNLAGMLL